MDSGACISLDTQEPTVSKKSMSVTHNPVNIEQSNYLISSVLIVRWGRHIVLQMSALASSSASASHHLLREPLLKFFLGGMFFVPQGIDICYDLDLCSQGQAVRAFFIRMGFS